MFASQLHMYPNVPERVWRASVALHVESLAVTASAPATADSPTRSLHDGQAATPGQRISLFMQDAGVKKKKLPDLARGKDPSNPKIFIHIHIHTFKYK